MEYRPMRHSRKIHPPIFILTGRRRSGKTTFLVELISLFREKGLSVDGILAHSSSGEEFPDSYLLEHIATGSLAPLCRRNPATGWIRTGPFYFNPETIEAGKRILTSPGIIKNDLVILDEIGKFELEGTIWADSLSRLLRKASCPLILSVRKTFIEGVIRNWDLQSVEILDVDQSGPVDALKAILERMKINKL